MHSYLFYYFLLLLKCVYSPRCYFSWSWLWFSCSCIGSPCCSRPGQVSTAEFLFLSNFIIIFFFNIPPVLLNIKVKLFIKKNFLCIRHIFFNALLSCMYTHTHRAAVAAPALVHTSVAGHGVHYGY